jgi:AcrR family transcriptional regulator
LIFVSDRRGQVDQRFRTRNKIVLLARGYDDGIKKSAFGISSTNSTRKPSAAAGRLLDAVKVLLSKFAPDEITTVMILEEAGVARNTLYLHYDNHAALIEAALLSVFLDSAKSHADFLKKSVKDSRNKADFIKQSINLIKVSQDREFKNFRVARCRLIAHSDKSARFSKILGMEQSKLNESFAKSFEALQKKGWMSDEVSPYAAALFVQAMTFGRIIDDVSSKKNRWEVVGRSVHFHHEKDDPG